MRGRAKLNLRVLLARKVVTEGGGAVIWTSWDSQSQPRMLDGGPIPHPAPPNPAWSSRSPAPDTSAQSCNPSFPPAQQNYPQLHLDWAVNFRHPTRPHHPDLAARLPSSPSPRSRSCHRCRPCSQAHPVPPHPPAVSLPPGSQHCWPWVPMFLRRLRGFEQHPGRIPSMPGAPSVITTDAPGHCPGSLPGRNHCLNPLAEQGLPGLSLGSGGGVGAMVEHFCSVLTSTSQCKARASPQLQYSSSRTVCSVPSSHAENAKRNGWCGPLEVEPPDPVVAMAVGESRELTCRLACADGRAASVQWRGLDTSLGAVQSGAGISVLSVRNASLSAAGTRVCVGSCGNLTFQQAVQLLVFAFPNQLTVTPEALVAGQGREVACTAHNIMPAGPPTSPDTFSMSLLLGDGELEGAEALGWDVEEEPQEGEDPLFQVTTRWLLPPWGTPALHTLHCQATLRLPGLELSHRQPIPVLQGLTSPEPPAMSPQEHPGTTLPDLRIRIPPEPPTTPREHPITTPLELQITTSPEVSPEQASAHSPGSPGLAPRNSSTRPCHPEIHESSALGVLELLCEAACGPGVAVRWTQAPGGLANYETRESGAQAWLSSRSTLWTKCHPEGWFQCRLDPGGQVANLHLVPETCSSPTSAALWTGSLVLGLLLLAFLIYHLQKHCRHTS
nr:mucosal addressin cell adhesion molecule 1 isoform X2 [Vicugna pacos]